MKNLYFIEVTDNHDGEARYSWVIRHCIAAKSKRGAVSVLSRRSGINWRHDYGERYNSVSGATCAFINYYEPEYHDHFYFATDDRKGN